MSGLGERGSTQNDSSSGQARPVKREGVEGRSRGGGRE